MLDIHYKHQTNSDKEITQFLCIYVLAYFIVLYCQQYKEIFLSFYELLNNTVFTLHKFITSLIY